jgi:putative colanic acid biosynthesis acetyltransferase WcaF
LIAAMETGLKIEDNRRATKYPLRIQAARVLWGAGRIVFRMLPRPLYRTRNALLRLFGAKVGQNVQISNTAIIYFPWELSIGKWSSVGDFAYLYNLGALMIGERVTISQRAHLCGGTHDYRDSAMPLVRCPIEIRNEAWICADAFVGPGVTIGEGAVVGARTVVVKSVESRQVVAGNPARVVGEREPGGTRD